MNERYFARLGDTLISEKLENGLSIFIVPRRDFSKSFAFFATNYGGIDMRFTLNGEETVTPAGVAHFLEHKMFDMPDGNALQTLTNLGASPNAFTSNDITGYFFETTANFEPCLETLLRFVSTPYFTAESCLKEQGIIGQEIRMTEDDPDWRCYMGLMEALYENHPVRVSVAGTVESIAEITDKTLYDCHRAFYNPANMVLTVVGNVEPQQVIDIAKRVLPQHAGEAAVSDLGAAEPEGRVTARVESAMEVAGLMFTAGFKCAPSGKGRSYLLNEYSAALAGDVIMGRSSPLYARLYSEGLIDSSFSFGFDSCRGAAMLTFSGKSRDPDAVVEAVREEAERIGRQGIDEAYFSLRRKAGYGAMIRSFDSFENICISQACAYFAQSDLFELPEVFDSITADALVDFIRSNLTGDRLAVSVIKPIKE